MLRNHFYFVAAASTLSWRLLFQHPVRTSSDVLANPLTETVALISLASSSVRRLRFEPLK
ncbi:hypothetical protein ZHAS_00014000 [Anopheles sinensis]|uniref:Uncharacterized protein n=1 Tax=Anopheles sinensis TaxID=74873 RepID=A0A084W735_ANOSI|nr:hypothetical protein ZHAS_00014000 [Anopheles sinensis]